MKIFFFGDSICFGQGVSIHKTWVTRISQDLEELGKKYNVPITVVNSSTNGNTTRLGLERLHFDVLSHGADVILIQFGMNDCNYWETDRGMPRISKLAFKANLLEMIERLKKFGVKKIIINTNHPAGRINNFSYADISYQESNRAYNTIIRRLARKEKDVILNDIEHHFYKYMKTTKTALNELLQKDNVHLNIKGHELYFFITYPLIKKVVTNFLKQF